MITSTGVSIRCSPRSGRSVVVSVVFALLLTSSARAVDPIIDNVDRTKPSASVHRPDGTSRRDRHLPRIDGAKLDDPQAARRAFDAARNSRTATTVISGHTVQITYYDPELYRCLLERLGSEKHYSIQKAQQLLDLTLDEMGGQIELYVKIESDQMLALSSRRPTLAESCSLERVDGKAYHPRRAKMTKETSVTAFTLWFDGTEVGQPEPASEGGGNCVLLIPISSGGKGLKARTPLKLRNN